MTVKKTWAACGPLSWAEVWVGDTLAHINSTFSPPSPLFYHPAFISFLLVHRNMSISMSVVYTLYWSLCLDPLEVPELCSQACCLQLHALSVVVPSVCSDCADVCVCDVLGSPCPLCPALSSGSSHWQLLQHSHGLVAWWPLKALCLLPSDPPVCFSFNLYRFPSENHVPSEAWKNMDGCVFSLTSVLTRFLP